MEAADLEEGEDEHQDIQYVDTQSQPPQHCTQHTAHNYIHIDMYTKLHIILYTLTHTLYNVRDCAENFSSVIFKMNNFKTSVTGMRKVYYSCMLLVW